MQRLSYKFYKNKLTISLGTKKDFKGVIVQVNLKYKIRLTKIFKYQDVNHQHVLHDNLLFCVFKVNLVPCICCFVYSKWWLSQASDSRRKPIGKFVGLLYLLFYVFQMMIVSSIWFKTETVDIWSRNSGPLEYSPCRLAEEWGSLCAADFMK